MVDVFFSSILYLAIFLSTIFFARIAERRSFFSEHRGAVTKIAIFMMMAIPCFFAGMRGISVGKDTKNYYAVFEMAKRSSTISSVGNGISSFENELGFKTIYWLISRLTSNVFWGLAFYQLLTIVPIIKCVKKLKGEISLSWTIAVYMFCFYNNSFNLMRQSAAAAFIIYGALLLMKIDDSSTKLQRVHPLLVLAFSIFLHKAAFIGVILSILSTWLCKSKIGSLWKGVVSICCIMLVLGYVNVVNYLNSSGIMGSVFAKYANIFIYRTIDTGYFLNPFSGYSLTDIFCRSLLIFPALIYISNRNCIVTFIKNNVLYGLLIYLIVLFMLQTNYGQRISMFLDMYIILLIPYAAKGKNAKIMMAVILLIYWTIWIMFEGWSGSRIYSFA